MAQVRAPVRSHAALFGGLPSQSYRGIPRITGGLSAEGAENHRRETLILDVQETPHEESRQQIGISSPA